MHSKRKGNIGQFGIGLELTKLGYSVFTEEGDISKIDIIAEKDGTLLRIQCKSTTPSNNCLELDLVKTGPNYSFRYEIGTFDYFAIWDLEDNTAYLIPAIVIQSNKRSFSLRKIKTKNSQKLGVHFAEDYTVEKMLNKGL